MARMGHDSECAAIIYQHEARGADAAITDAIDAHVESEQGKGGDDGGASGTVVHAGTLMARGHLQDFHGPGARDQREPLTWDFTLERVTGIEPALSAWESDRSGPLTVLTWTSNAPLVTVTDPSIPGLMTGGPVVLDAAGFSLTTLDGRLGLTLTCPLRRSSGRRQFCR